MASRDYLRHLVSNTAPAGTRAGDEYYDPISNKLYKTLVVNGTTVSQVEVLLTPTGGTASYANTLTVKATTNSVLNIPANYTLASADGRLNLDVFVDGYKMVKGLDYNERTANTITTLISIPAGSTIEYKILR